MVQTIVDVPLVVNVLHDCKNATMKNDKTSCANQCAEPVLSQSHNPSSFKHVANTFILETGSFFHILIHILGRFQPK